MPNLRKVTRCYSLEGKGEMKSVVFFLTITLLFLCGCSDSDPMDGEQKESFDFPFFVDTMMFNENHKVLAEIEGAHYPYYFGKLTDTVLLFHNILPPLAMRTEGWKMRFRPPAESFDDYFHDRPVNREIQTWESVKLKVHIDLTQSVQNYGRDAFPVLVENATNDTVQVGYGYYVPIILEAKDNKGNWRPLEYLHVYQCGNGVRDILLPPKEFTVTSVVKTSGSFRTKLRLNLGASYSREYVGSIDSLNFCERSKRHIRKSHFESLSVLLNGLNVQSLSHTSRTSVFC